ncbi:hypothetical protein OU798_18180 [Prolixibacteraceae bacterium Z1-6]|uniref:Uncharacterized protein n=1 Tax=Draconibacterium aestuarii TaxID=2998507 RepID=A0A9X3FGK0_9BACT|nr:hypothetical protein [Prolixibacteraceae bacterium Z1-6]
MRKILPLYFCLLSGIIYGQSIDDSNMNHNNQQAPDSLIWISQLGEKGLELTEDSLIISDEFQKVLQDSSYRTLLYPPEYTWSQATQFLQSKQLKKAFWYFINLYANNNINKEIVVKSVLAYDKLFKMDEIMVNTFYTYSFMDPEVSIIKDGKPEIIRPDILETKLKDVKEIVGYIYAYRNEHKKNLPQN